METKQNKMSGFDKMAVDVMACIVPGQTQRLADSNGVIWKSSAVDVGGMAITTITKNDIEVCKIVYDYESSREERFYY